MAIYKTRNTGILKTTIGLHQWPSSAVLERRAPSQVSSADMSPDFQTDLSNSTYSFFHLEVEWSWVFTSLSFLVNDTVMRIHSNLNLTVCMMAELRGCYMKCKQDCRWLLFIQMQTERPGTLPGCQKDSKFQHISTNSSLSDNLWLYGSVILRLPKKKKMLFPPTSKKSDPILWETHYSDGHVS